ncbi:MAG: hypothetical protein C4526_00040 [Nitrospiraceae bacterium]|nr:MAG: hypothetical protein C4526_00040 [Nitrospiraceae bacterium]
MVRIKKIKIFLGVVVILCLIYFFRFPAIYYSCMWLLEYKSNGDTMLMVTDILEMQGSKIVPLLVNTYEDTKAHVDKRSAAASVLMTLDRGKAEDLFVKHLEDRNDNIVVEAIYDLWVIESTKPYNQIIKKVSSLNYKMRVAVARYLENIPVDESVAILNSLMLNDPNEEVRETAKRSLSEIYRTEK